MKKILGMIMLSAFVCAIGFTAGCGGEAEKPKSASTTPKPPATAKGVPKNNFSAEKDDIPSK